LAGARAFAPGCVLVRETGAVHLLSITDDGVPPDIPIENLYPITWNPVRLVDRLAAAPGLAAARRIGVDGLTPLMETLLRAAFPAAELVDGQVLMLAARARKLPAEIECIRAAIALASQALTDVVELARPGARERDLLARFEQRIAELGTTTPAFEATFGHRFPSERALTEGEALVCDVGVLVDGYQGCLARTITVGEKGATTTTGPVDALFAALTAVIRPGATGTDLWDAWDGTGVARPSEPVAYGVGLGVEPPVVGADTEPITEGMTLSVRAEVDGRVRRDTVLVTATGAALVSPWSHENGDEVGH
jgi:Xaa-Pro aminopeptidase